MRSLKMVLILYIFLFFINSNSKAQALEIVDGIAYIVFVKDTTYGEPIYWQTKKEFHGQYFEEDVGYVLARIDGTCDKYYKVQFPAKRKSVYDLPQYQSQEEESVDYQTHLGGDIFMTPDGKIVLAFQMKAEVIRLEEPPCEKFYLQSSYHCHVEREPIRYPIYLVVNVIESSSLDSVLLKRERLEPYGKKSFTKAECD